MTEAIAAQFNNDAMRERQKKRRLDDAPEEHVAPASDAATSEEEYEDDDDAAAPAEDGPCAAAPAENALGVMAESGGEVATSEPRDEFERMSKSHFQAKVRKQVMSHMQGSVLDLLQRNGR